jgi:hypothetical protein
METVITTMRRPLGIPVLSYSEAGAPTLERVGARALVRVH